MLQLFRLFLVLSLAVCGTFGAASKSTVSGEQRLQQMQDMASRAKNNVISLDDNTYPYYVTSAPAPYSVVVFLTAAHPKFRCGVCKQLDTEFQLMASSYAETQAEFHSQNPVFFVRADYESSQKIFQQYSLNQVPVVFHIPPRLIDRGDESYIIGARDKYYAPPSPDAESLASFVREKCGVSVSIKRSMAGTYFTLIAIFVILGLLVRPVINSLPKILNFIRNKNIWFMVSAGVYTCAISGLIFDIIRSPPMYHMNPNTGQINFFYSQSGTQFVVEGFVIGFLNLACAIGVIFFSHFALKMKNPQSRFYGIVGGILAFLFCFMQIRGLYRMKNRWYGVAM